MELTERPTIIGRSDKADFPQLELVKLNVKIDSGAYTSAIHCCKIGENPNRILEVIFLDDQYPKYTGKVFQFRKFKTKVVRSSNGVSEERYIINTKIKVAKELYDINLSLTFRGDMRFPILIGRKFLSRNHFVVNPRLKNHLYKKTFIKH